MILFVDISPVFMLKILIVGLQRVGLLIMVPNPINPPQGCHFHPRCPLVESRCKTGASPALVEVAPGHSVACHLVTGTPDTHSADATNPALSDTVEPGGEE